MKSQHSEPAGFSKDVPYQAVWLLVPANREVSRESRRHSHSNPSRHMPRFRWTKHLDRQGPRCAMPPQHKACHVLHGQMLRAQSQRSLSQLTSKPSAIWKTGKLQPTQQPAGRIKRRSPREQVSFHAANRERGHMNVSPLPLGSRAEGQLSSLRICLAGLKQGQGKASVTGLILNASMLQKDAAA